MFRPVAFVGAMCLAAFLVVSVHHENVTGDLVERLPFSKRRAEAKNQATKYDPTKNKTLRRMVYRVKESRTQASVKYNSRGDSIRNDETRYWNRVLQQSTTAPPAAPVETQPPTPTPTTEPPTTNAGTQPPTEVSGPPDEGEGEGGNEPSTGGRISSVFFCKWYGTGCGGGSNWLSRSSSSRTRTQSRTSSTRSPSSRSSWWSRLSWSTWRRPTYQYSPRVRQSSSWTTGKSSRYPRSRYSSSRYNHYQYGGKWRERNLAVETSGPAEQIDAVSTNSGEASRRLDFFIAGFPKCGTTTLLYSLKNHPETAIGEREHCDITSPKFSDEEALMLLDDAMDDLTEANVGATKTAIKCPAGLRNSYGMKRLVQHSPHARIVIGLRHPVKYFQSFYNYRITEVHTKGKKDEPIPSVEELVGSDEWKGVSTDNARFETFLMQLGKTKMSVSDRKEFIGHPGMAVVPSSFNIFLYSLEQLEDTDEERGGKFRQDMKEFLQLEKPLAPFQQENINHFVGERAFPETIDICDAKYDHIRGLLVYQGKKSEEWIRNQFLVNPDVSVGNKDHFLQILDTWGKDPCIRGSMTAIGDKTALEA